MSAIGEDERVVLAKITVAVTSGPGSLSEQVDDALERHPEALEATGALFIRLGGDVGRDVEQFTDAIGQNHHGKRGRPALGRQLEIFRSGDQIDPVYTGLKGRQFKA